MSTVSINLTTEFIEGLRESGREVSSGKTKAVNSFNDFVS